MKVLIINVQAVGSSTAKIAYGYYKRLKREGHEAIFAFGMGKSCDPSDPNVIKFTPTIEPKIHFRYNLLTGYHGSFGPIAAMRINRIIDRFRPDVVQLYNLHGYYLNIPKLFHKLSKENIPVVYGMLDEYPYLGYCCYAYDCSKYQSGCRNCEFQFRDRYMKSLFFNRARQTYKQKEKDYDSIQRMIFTGPEWVVERAAESSLLQGRELRIVDEYIDTEQTFTIRNTTSLRDKLGISEDKIIILDVAPSADHRKGVQYFIETAKAVSRISDRYVFINVGYQGKPLQLDNFIGIGYVSDQRELAEYYSLADLFVCTSMADTMPNTCLDALACGTPILGFDITGVPFVAEAPLGIFVKPGDVEELTGHIIQTEKKTETVQQSCRKYAVKRYSLDTYFKRQMEVYRELMEQEK